MNLRQQLVPACFGRRLRERGTTICRWFWTPRARGQPAPSPPSTGSRSRAGTPQLQLVPRSPKRGGNSLGNEGLQPSRAGTVPAGTERGQQPHCPAPGVSSHPRPCPTTLSSAALPMVLGTRAPHKPGQGPGTAPKPQPWGQDPLLPEGILQKPAAGAAAGKAAALLRGLLRRHHGCII